MKKLISMGMLISIAFTLVGCAGSNSADTIRVKCPACGYEFDALSGR